MTDKPVEQGEELTVGQLRERLLRAEEMLRAIRRGEVDALVVEDPSLGERVCTLDGADYTWRLLVEEMQEGAAILSPGGTILYANPALTRILDRPAAELVGRRFAEFVPREGAADVSAALQVPAGAAVRFEADLRTPDGRETPVLVRAAGTSAYGMRSTCLVSTDLTEQKRREHALEAARDLLEQRVADRTAELQTMNRTLDQRVRQRTEEVEERLRQIRLLAGQLADTEQRERRRLARFLHDHLQQLLAAARFHVTILRDRVTDERLGRAAQKADELLQQSIDASRSLSVELSPPVLGDAGLAAGLEWLARTMRERHGLVVALELESDADATELDLRLLLFEAARELLFNVVKHAGVREARLALRRCGGALRVRVEDEGCGYARDQVRDGFGLTTLRDRIQAVGGELSVETAPGQGVRVEASVPATSPPPSPLEAAG